MQNGSNSANAGASSVANNNNLNNSRNFASVTTSTNNSAIEASTNRSLQRPAGTANPTSTTTTHAAQSGTGGPSTTSTSTSTLTTNVTPSECLQKLVEEHLTQVIRDVASVSRHAKRARLHPKSATTTTTGSSTTATPENGGYWTLRRLHASDVNMALQLRGFEPLYGTAVAATTMNESSTTSSNTTILDLQEWVRQSAMAVTQPPSETAASVHWLAVQGKVPEIPQNIVVTTPTTSTTSNKTGTPATTGATTTSAGGTVEPSSSQNPLLVQQLQTAFLSEELRLYFGRVTTAVESSTQNRSSSWQSHEKTIMILRGVLESVARDAGLQELVPFLIRYSQQALYQHVEHSVTVLQLILALLQNPFLHLELHIHELLPALMTCIVTTRTTSATAGRGQSLAGPSSTPSKLAQQQQNQHWLVRQWSSLALVVACHCFQKEYVTLQARVLKTLCQGLDPRKPLQSRYGSLIALAHFGPKAVDAFALDVLVQYWPMWRQEALDLKSGTDSSVTPENLVLFEKALNMCQLAALEALHVYFQGMTLVEQANRAEWDWYEVLGDAATPLILMAEPDQCPYATCFV